MRCQYLRRIRSWWNRSDRRCKAVPLNMQSRLTKIQSSNSKMSSSWRISQSRSIQNNGRARSLNHTKRWNRLRLKRRVRSGKDQSRNVISSQTSILQNCSRFASRKQWNLRIKTGSRIWHSISLKSPLMIFWLGWQHSQFSPSQWWSTCNKQQLLSNWLIKMSKKRAICGTKVLWASFRSSSLQRFLLRVRMHSKNPKTNQQRIRTDNP